MATPEVTLFAVMILLMAIVGVLVMQVRAIAREVRGVVKGVGAEGQETREHLTNGLNGLIEMQANELTALRTFIEGQPKAAAQVLRQAEVMAPKPHACRFRFSSEEQTNG